VRRNGGRPRVLLGTTAPPKARHGSDGRMDGQDWEPLKIGGAGSGSGAGAGGPKRSAEAIRQAKLADADGPVHVKVLTPDAVRTIQDYRRQNSLTQKQLDQRLSFPANTVQALESRKAGPSTKQLQVLNQLLKSGLTLG
jgi:DNA-binding transcriptional regulator YiaG